MKKIVTIALLVCIFLCTGCVHTYWNEKKELVYNEITNSTNELYQVRIGQYALLIKSDISNLKIPYHGESITLGGYSTVGDAEMMEKITKALVYSLAAYSSMGSVPAIEVILEAFKRGEVDKIVAKVQNGEPITKEDFPVAVAFVQRKKK
jgi:hypothetical protein